MRPTIPPRAPHFGALVLSLLLSSLVVPTTPLGAQTVLNPEQVVSANDPTEPVIRVFHQGLVYICYVEGDTILIRSGPFVDLPPIALSSGFPQGNPEISITLGAPLSVFFDQDDPTGGGSGVFYREGSGGNFGASVEIAPSPELDRDPSVAVETGFGSSDVVWVREIAGVPTIVHRSIAGGTQILAEGDSPDLGSFDRTHHEVVYIRSGAVYHRSADLNVWGPETAVSGALSAMEPRIATDDTGAVHITFLSGGQVWYVRRPNGGGYTAPIAVTPGLTDVTESEIVVDAATGGVQVFFISGGDLLRRFGISGQFFPFENLTNTPGDPEDRISIGIDPSGYAHVIYRRDGTLYYRNEVPPPVASFEAQPASGLAPLEVSFTSTSGGVATGWQWDFGDGTTSSQQSPTHLYDAPGAYDVTLTVTGPGGVDTITEIAAVQVVAPQNTLRIPAVTVFRGQTGVTLPVLVTHPEPLMGYQMGLSWDATVFSYETADILGTVTEPLTPDFIIINTHTGPDGIEAITMGVLFDTIPPADGRVIDPGEDQRILHLTVGISPTAPIDVPSLIQFDTTIADPPILNTLTVDGISQIPLQVDGVITIVPFTFPPPLLFRRGDYDGDGTIAINDGIALLSFLFSGGAPPTCMDAADVNDDGQVNISDPISLLNFLFVGGLAPPYPWPSPGSDPTEDALPGC